MKARMHQRKHQRSPHALRKDYDFARLPLTVDPGPLVAELQGLALPWIESLWKWHHGTQFCILRAGPTGSLAGDELITGTAVDAPVLARLPAFARVLDELLPAPVPLAWIGRSPPGSVIRFHIDNTAHWDEHHRVHIPLCTSPGARLCVMGRYVHMPAGSVWLFNNSRPHGAINDGPERLHLVMDWPSSPEVEALVARAQRVQGERDDGATARLSEDPLVAVRRDPSPGPEVLARMAHQ